MNEQFLNRAFHGDCLEWLPKIETGSIDAIICDLPYGTTKCKWDSPLDLEKLWNEYERIIKYNGAIVLFGSQPFTSNLVMSNPKLFRYEWIWNKTLFANFMHLKRQPAKKHENILVFYKKQPVYNPQMEKGEPYKNTRKKREHKIEGTYGKVSDRTDVKNDGVRYPSSIQLFSNPNKNNVHPTQKPLDLVRYLVRTYTNEFNEQGERSVILDNTAGSGTLGVACINEGRNFILMEKEWEYCEIANERIEQARIQQSIK